MLERSNTSIVLAGITPEQWLAQVDAGVGSTFRALIARHRFYEASALMLAHLEKTETVRTRVHGHAPAFDLVVVEARMAYYENFRDCALRAMTRNHQLVGGVNVTRAGHAAAAPGSKVTPAEHVPVALTLVPCAPDNTTCDWAFGPWRCDSTPHPEQPDEHYMITDVAQPRPALKVVEPLEDLDVDAPIPFALTAVPDQRGGAS